MWKLVREPHKVFARNPLAAVVFAVDFEPILKIGEGQGIPEFQERVRSRFPKYSQGSLLDVIVTAPDQLETRQVRAHEFSASDSLKVALSARRISRDARTHKSREELVEDVDLIMRALNEVYEPIVVQRIGVRYVNIIDAVEVSDDLARPVKWSALLSDRYAHIPSDIVDMERTLFANELTSAMQRGGMTVRYGLTRRPDKGRPCVHLDIDRYIAEAIPCNDISGLVSKFTEDMYDLFMTAIGPDLLEWMNGREH